ncbi:NAD(P)/FAD-dependent oxidoreductase [Mesorhizobium sp. KR9-304]|uniref:NAD(P)/FAD-dependent oxidoreductase n=1 Tax=Mesorhizobium sp. KR9-304 TaxID=3156614 RepID=UPI0032B48A59
MHIDVAVIGGSFAGLSAALQLARARRSVTVFDAGEPRNRFAAASHGFLTRDGARPADMLAEARRQLAAYPTARFEPVRVETATGNSDAFALICSDGRSMTARRIVLAHGVIDSLPDIPGLADEWGKRVAHCPYCHGYEFGGEALGVLAANGPVALHQAMLVREWGPVTLFLNGMLEPNADEAKLLDAHGVTIERAKVEAVVSGANGLTMRLAGGRGVEIAGLFTQPRARLSSAIAELLGCALTEGPFGPFVTVDDRKRTTASGVFAAGDLARPAPSVALAVADGALAGATAHQSLVFDQAVAA